MTVAIKQRAHELIEALPDDATWQDLLYALDLRADAEAGRADAEAGRADAEAGRADAKAGRLTEAEELRRDYGLHR